MVMKKKAAPVKRVAPAKKEALRTVNLAAETRPTRLSHYIGQPQITKSLLAMMKAGSLPATILIQGPTGCGKTTLATILARYLNCDTNNSCGKCISCRSMDSAVYEGGTHPDYVQIDAGSKGKIEDTRNLIEMMRSMPQFKKRVYVIDEAHAMTKQSANALLVSIENPPPDTVFILCTTESHKLLPTVVGRCLNLNVKQVDGDEIHTHLCNIVTKYSEYEFSKAEWKKVDTLCRIVAYNCNGFVRNAVQGLQGVLPLLTSGEEIDLEAITSQLSSTSEVDVASKALDLVVGFVEQDLSKVLLSIRMCDNVLQLADRARWVVHGIIGDCLKANKFTTPEVREAIKRVGKNSKFNLASLVYFQRVLAVASEKITTTIVPPGVILEGEVTVLMAQIYDGRLALSIGEVNDVVEERPSEQRRNVRKR